MIWILSLSLPTQLLRLSTLQEYSQVNIYVIFKMVREDLDLDDYLGMVYLGLFRTYLDVPRL